MRGRTRKLFRKEKSSEENPPFFKKKMSQTKENASPGFFSSSGIQTKLKMGKAGDVSEKQADAVADKVVSGPGKSGLLQRDPLDGSVRKAEDKEEAAAKFEVQSAEDEEKSAAKLEVQKAEDEETSAKLEVQKAEEDEGSAKLEVQKAEDEEASAKLEVQKAEDEETSAKFELNKAEDEEASTKLEVQKAEEEVSSRHIIQRKEENKSNNTFETRLKAAKSGGRPLPTKVKEEMEHRMGKDFSKVLIHTDDTAIALCREIKAQAFTNGYHIFFNKGKFQPDSKSGKHLLAHELTHVVQQKM